MKKITIAAFITLPMLAEAGGIPELLEKPYLDKYGKKTCTTGKPCGNSCINRNYTCHIGEVTYTPIPTPKPTIIPTLTPIPTPAPTPRPTIIPTLAPAPTKAPTPVPTPAPAVCSTVNLYAVIDGDTIYVTDGVGKMEKVRVNQIDAPERSQDYGKESKQCMKDIVTNKVLEICRDGKDKYGRTIADVKANMADAGHMMVMNGCAWAYSQYLKPGSDLPSVEQSARQAKIGLWANPNPIEPWDYRHGTVPVPVNASGAPAINVSNATIAKVWDRLFDWAEQAYPEKLVNGGNTESLPDGMMYRCYFPSDKIFCIGNKGDKAYNYEGTTVNDIGNIQPYLDKAAQEGF